MEGDTPMWGKVLFPEIRYWAGLVTGRPASSDHPPSMPHLKCLNAISMILFLIFCFTMPKLIVSLLFVLFVLFTVMGVAATIQWYRNRRRRSIRYQAANEALTTFQNRTTAEHAFFLLASTRNALTRHDLQCGPILVKLYIVTIKHGTAIRDTHAVDDILYCLFYRNSLLCIYTTQIQYSSKLRIVNMDLPFQVDLLCSIEQEYNQDQNQDCNYYNFYLCVCVRVCVRQTVVRTSYMCVCYKY